MNSYSQTAYNTLPTGEKQVVSLLSLFYLPPVEWFAAMYRSGKCIIDQHEHYVKQTYRNRCRILMPDGPQDLIIPVEKPEAGNCSIRDIRLSDHGNWQHHHWNALRTAYGKTPFFEYYADDFHKFYHQPYTFLFDFNEQLRQVVCSLMDIEPVVEYSTYYIKDKEGIEDYRQSINPRQTANVVKGYEPRTYYQVFSTSTPFRPNLSIVDLLFNMGPEGALYL